MLMMHWLRMEVRPRPGLRCKMLYTGNSIAGMSIVVGGHHSMT